MEDEPADIASPPPASQVAAAVPRTIGDIAPFVLKLYDIVNDRTTTDLVDWSPEHANTAFVIYSPTEFAATVLPKHFKHSNFSSFVRQLNLYGFRKVESPRAPCCFQQENFRADCPHLLKLLIRRVNKSSSPGHSPNPKAQAPQNLHLPPLEDYVQAVPVPKRETGEPSQKKKAAESDLTILLMEEISRLKIQNEETLKTVAQLQGDLERSRAREAMLNQRIAAISTMVLSSGPVQPTLQAQFSPAPLHSVVADPAEARKVETIRHNQEQIWKMQQTLQSFSKKRAQQPPVVVQLDSEIVTAINKAAGIIEASATGEVQFQPLAAMSMDGEEMANDTEEFFETDLPFESGNSEVFVQHFGGQL